MTAQMEYPKKLYYSISEVAEIAGIKAHVLRYWESEFPTLRPRKTRAGARRYRQPDIDAVLAIKELLYVQGFKIAGARKFLREESRTPAVPAAAGQIALGFDAMSAEDRSAFIRKELVEILELVRQLGPDKNASPKKMQGRG